MGKGWAKSKGAIPVRGPSVLVVRVGEGKAELDRGVNRVSGEVGGAQTRQRGSRDRGAKAADFNISAVDGVKEEGGVGRGS